MPDKTRRIPVGVSTAVVICSLLAVAMGCWFFYDGYVTYPQAIKSGAHYTAMDVLMQKICGYICTGIGLIAMLVIVLVLRLVGRSKEV